MINNIRLFVRRHELLRRLLHVFRFKSVMRDLCFKHKEIQNKPFRYRLPDGNFIKLYPKGQISKSLYAGSFEQEEVRLFSDFVKPGMHIVDVGANIGLYSIIACKNFQSVSSTNGGLIWAFEPSSENFERLLANLSLNECNNSVTPVHLGLGNRDNEELFLRRDLGYGDAERYILPDNRIPCEDLSNVKTKVEEENIKLTTLDSFMGEIENPRVDFMKIDAEGYEFFVLQGARNILRFNPNLVIMLECTALGTKRAGHTQKDVQNILNEFGFRCFYWDSDRHLWGNDKTTLLQAGNIFACRNVNQLRAP